ncbi:MAG: hypothetical protein J6Y11_00880 [Paludibacteraceae bacterium]|nr:hypothetical protein [Paludibacteraceae bacterium]
MKGKAISIANLFLSFFLSFLISCNENKINIKGGDVRIYEKPQISNFYNSVTHYKIIEVLNSEANVAIAENLTWLIDIYNPKLIGTGDHVLLLGENFYAGEEIKMQGYLAEIGICSYTDKEGAKNIPIIRKANEKEIREKEHQSDIISSKICK